MQIAEHSLTLPGFKTSQLHVKVEELCLNKTKVIVHYHIHYGRIYNYYNTTIFCFLDISPFSLMWSN